MTQKDEIAPASTRRLRFADSIPVLICPKCGAELSKRAKLLMCLACRQTWKVIDGVPHLVATFPLWGEISREHMEAVNRIALTQVCKATLLESREPNARSSAQMILKLNRANWRWLLHHPWESSVFDIGAGLGTNSHLLRRYFREVVPVEPVLEPMRFMSRYFEQEGSRA